MHTSVICVFMLKNNYVFAGSSRFHHQELKNVHHSVLKNGEVLLPSTLTFLIVSTSVCMCWYSVLCRLQATHLVCSLHPTWSSLYANTGGSASSASVVPSVALQIMM